MKQGILIKNKKWDIEFNAPFFERLKAGLSIAFLGGMNIKGNIYTDKPIEIVDLEERK